MSLPDYKGTLALIAALKLDEYSDETLDGVKAQQRLALRHAAPHLAEKDLDLLFLMIWNTGRVAGHFQTTKAQRVAGEAIQATIMSKVAPNLQRAGILPTCNNPECDHCRVIDHERNPKPASEAN